MKKELLPICKEVYKLATSNNWRIITEDTFFYYLLKQNYEPAKMLVRASGLRIDTVINALEEFHRIFTEQAPKQGICQSEKALEYFKGNYNCESIESDVLMLIMNNSDNFSHSLLEGSVEMEELSLKECNHNDSSPQSPYYSMVKNDGIPYIGRDKEIDSVIQTLCRKTKSNPIIVGEPGVGKTSMVKGLCARIESGNVPDCLKNKPIYSLDIPSIIAGSSMRGEAEEKLQTSLEEIMQSDDSKPIIFIDEIHNLISTGVSQSYDIANLLKPMLVEGKISVIGATTTDEYNKTFKKDKAFDRRFYKIKIEEPSLSDTCKIIKGIKKEFEVYHNVKYANRVIEETVELSSRYITDRYLPDKAIDILDEAGSRAKIKGKQKVEKADIAAIISEKTGIPVGNIESDEKKKLKTLEKQLKGRIFGQDKACEMVSNLIRVNRVFKGDSPISFFFVGPTGTGKTELAKTIASVLNLNLIRIDCSEYQEKISASKLIGSAPGYVGYEEGGKLINDIQNNPYSLILFDEIEKAHPDLFNTLLQLLDYGVMTDGRGVKGDFKNAIIVFTSNCGASDVGKNIIGFSQKDNKTGNEVMTAEMNKTFAPEFLNRLSGIIPFDKVDGVAVQIIKQQLKNLEIELNKTGIKITFEDTVINQIEKSGITIKTGARMVKRVIQDKIKPLLAMKIIDGTISDTIVLYAENDEFKVREGVA